MINKAIIITCDWCGANERFNADTNSKRSANAKIKSAGWIVGKFGKDHYCSIECKNKKK